MTITSFFQSIHHKQLTESSYFLVTAQPPVLFLGLIKKCISQSYYLQTLDLTSLDDEALEAQLSMNFLGAVNYFWITGYYDLDAKRKKKVIALCEQYGGSNRAFMVVDTASKASTIVSIEIPDRLNAQQAENLLGYIMQSANTLTLLKHYFSRRQALSIDGLILLMEYAAVVGARSKEFLDSWLDYLIEPDVSLFMLATYFFSKKQRDFFSLWDALKDIYPDAFWTTYWSEQLFRAYGYSMYAKKQDFARAKKIGYRLPFSFLQKDWRSIKPQALVDAHNTLYQSDWLSKNSLHPYFESIFLRFFQV